VKHNEVQRQVQPLLMGTADDRVLPRIACQRHVSLMPLAATMIEWAYLAPARRYRAEDGHSDGDPCHDTPASLCDPEPC
jgi:hypothetical protein